MVPFLHFWALLDGSNSIFSSYFSFLKVVSTDNVFQYFTDFEGGGSTILRCIRTSDVIFEVYCFTKEDADVRKQALAFAPPRYIRTLDVMSEVNCVLLRRIRMIKKIACIRRRTFKAFSVH